MVQKIVAKVKIDCEDLIGTFLNESHYDTLIESDTDCFIENDCDITLKASCSKDCNQCTLAANEERAAFVFRKDYFSIEQQLGALSGLEEAASRNDHRGTAAGTKEGHENNGEDGSRQFVTNYQKDMMDSIYKDTSAILIEPKEDVIDTIRNKYPTEYSRSLCVGSKSNTQWVINRTKGNFIFDDWVDSIIPLDKESRKNELNIISEYMSKAQYGNVVNSGVAGFYDRYPRIPYGRVTSYTANNPEKFKLSLPYLQQLSKAFSKLMPKRYAAQKAACDSIDQEFVVPGTVFTTITVNKTFRTAAHRDAGDLSSGFSNLGVVTTSDCNFSGGYLVFPEYRIAINIRPGDLLLINNHEIIHGNTEIILENPEKDNRYSIVCYFREGMLNLGEKKYEDYRYNFVTVRRLNKDHPQWVKGWNGVSPSMWTSKEWYEYLNSQEDGERYLKLYHSEYFKVGFDI